MNFNGPVTYEMDPLLEMLGDVRRLEEYWTSVYKRKLTQAERQSYMLGRVHSLQSDLRVVDLTQRPAKGGIQ